MNQRQIIRRSAFRKMLGDISETTFWRLSKEPDFPQKIMLSKRLVGYYADEAAEYLNSRQAGGEA